MKASGAEIWEFYSENFPENCFVDYYNIDVVDDDDNCALEFSKKYDLRDFGTIYRHGSDTLQDCGESFEYYFKKWKNAKTSLTFAVSIPREKEAEFKEFVKSI